MSVSIRDFGKSTTGETVKLAVLKNDFIEVQLLSYAAIIHRIIVPNRKGNPVDVVLGYGTAADYELNTDSMGAAVGRFANRIAGAQFPLYEEIVHVTANQHGNCLHSGLRHAAWAVGPETGIRMEVLTTLPGMHLYSANFLAPVTDGKDGAHYAARDAVCFETEDFPDAPNHPNFPDTTLLPDQPYSSTTIYRFDIAPM